MLWCVIPRHSRVWSTAAFVGVDVPSTITVEGPLGAVPRRPRLGLAAGCGGAVPRQSWWGPLWVLFPAIPGPGLLLPLLLSVVSRQSWRRALWVLFSANVGWGLLLILLGLVPHRRAWQKALWARFPGIACWHMLLALMG